MGSILEHVEEIVLAVEDQDLAVGLFETLFGLKFDKSWMFTGRADLRTRLG